MFNEQNQTNEQHTSSQIAPNEQFGGHELLEADEAIGTIVGTLEHVVLYEQYIQDQALTGILQRQKGFLTQLYNTILDTLSTGQDPAVKTQTYLMQENNSSIYGLKQSQPKAPIQSASEFNDECVSTAMIGHLKSLTSSFTLTALEATNPVLRRIFADSIPNIIEMGYELYLYQNNKGYYQVAQLSQQDRQMITHAFKPTGQNMQH